MDERYKIYLLITSILLQINYLYSFLIIIKILILSSNPKHIINNNYSFLHHYHVYQFQYIYPQPK